MWNFLIGMRPAWMCGGVAFVFLSAACAHADYRLIDQQRSLAERMSLAACMVMADLEPRTNTELALYSAQQFNEILTASGIPTGAVHRHWSVFGPAVQQVASRDQHSVVVSQFLTLGAKLDTQLAALLAGEAQKQDTDETRVQLKIGEIRRLSQRIGGMICRITLDISPSASATTLQQSVADIENAVLALEEGSPADNVPEPLTMEFEDQIWMFRGDWDSLAWELSEISTQNVPDLDTLARLTESLGVLYIACETLSQVLTDSLS